MSEDIEKKRARDRKYAQSKKGIARTERYLANNESKLRKKREEERDRRFEAFCQRYNKHPDIIKRLINFEKGGIDIEKMDPWNTKVVRLWQEGERKKKEKPLSVGTVDYY